jgi:hypothetical protein
MPTNAHIDEHTRETVRTRRRRPPQERRSPARGPRRGVRTGAPAGPRYPDDLAGNYETTDGGW